MTAEITDPELALYGTGNSVADRMAREISRLRSERSGLSFVHAPGDLLEAISIVRHVSTMRRTSDRGVALSGATFDAIAAAAERGIAGALRPQRAASRGQLQEIVRGVVLDVLGPCNDRPQIPDEIADRVADAVAAKQPAIREQVIDLVMGVVLDVIGRGHIERMRHASLIATRVADALAAPQPAVDAARVRDVVREALSEWMGAYHDTAVPFDAGRVSEVISARAAEQLVGQDVADDRSTVADVSASPASTIDPALCRQLASEVQDRRRASMVPDGPISWSGDKLKAIARQIAAAAELAERHAELSATMVRRRAVLDEIRHSLDVAGVVDQAPLAMRVDTLTGQRDAARAECERLQGYLSAQQEECAELRSAIKKIQAGRWSHLDSILARLRVLLATEPAVTEERCGEIDWRRAELAGNPGADGVRFTLTIDDIPHLLAAARQLHALHAGLREVVGGEAPARAALDAQQLLDLQRMREDYRTSLEEAARKAERFPRFEKFAEARDERRRHLWLLDHLLSIFGGTQSTC